MYVAEAIADALATEADGLIFGLMGDANMPVWGALVKAGRTRIVSARHDGAAVLMADGYAKASGKLAVATVTCGPGLANCANALITAARAQTPMVVFTGETAPHGKGALQYLDQRQFARACDAHFAPLVRLDSLAQDIAEAFYVARTRRVPVILSLPAEHWEAELQWPWEYEPSSDFLAPQPHAPHDALVQQLASRLSAASRPVIVAGRGAVDTHARADIERLGDQVGALLATSLVAKGFFDGHAYDIGIAGSFSSALTERLMAEADFVLGIGASMNFFTTEGGMLFPSAQLARIDTKPFPSDIGVTPGLYVHGDAAHTTRELIRVLENKSVANEGYRSEATRAALTAPAVQQPRATDDLDPRTLMHELSRALPSNAQVVIGCGHFWAWPVCYLALPPGGRLFHTAAFGCIGLGLAQGIGAALASPERMTVVVEGDGGLLQGIQELHAAVDQKLPLVVLVMNDSGYGADVLKMRWKNRDPQGATWNSPDFVAVARGFGADGVRIEREEDLTAAFAQAMKHKGPFLIDARVSRSVVSDAYGKIHLGRQSQAPLLRPVPGSDWDK